MKSLKLYTGNRLDLLATLLAKALEVPLNSPFDPEIIILQSKGMERWLSMQLATHHGICANCRFPFPNAFLREIFQCVLPDLPDSSLFDPHFSTWRIMELLTRHLDQPGFESIRHYLDPSPWSLKQLQLSRRIAETFDQYILYRPDLITLWEQGADRHWQAVLWREFAAGVEERHRAALGKAFLETIRKAAPGAFALPQRISLFGISYLPPFHLQILDALARMTEVSVFFLNPCREYWGDIASDRDIGRITTRGQDLDRSPEELFLERGNPLLASMGTLGKEFLELLTSFDHEETSCFQDPGETSLLSCIQTDILDLGDRTQNPRKPAFSREDRSVQVHSCHSPMREVEVLYDRLLEFFELDPALRPGDILVMAPAIETYAPFIQAVFDAPDDEHKRLPYSIADRSLRKESRVARVFMEMLDLWDERLTGPQVLGILEAPAVRARFEMTEFDLDLVAHWVNEVRIRWGIDEQDRLRWMSPAFRENTWREGLERLLLGYAMPSQGEQLVGGILPYDHLEGREAVVLGRLIEFTEQLFEFVDSLNTPRMLSRWSADLLAVLSRFFQTDEDSKREILALRRVISELENIQELTGFLEAVSIKVIRWHLDQHLEREGLSPGFITGGVTFCSMLPMRSIPFKVICLLGLDGNSFPRQSTAPDFDLIVQHPRPGDRSVRNDDRYLFLEALVSAQEKLYISYTGQCSRDNSTIPPSVLVSELLDYVHGAFTVSRVKVDEASAGVGNGTADAPPVSGDEPESFIIKHRLQPFSSAYFQGSRELFTYSREWQKTARCLLREPGQPPIFVAGELSPPEEELKSVSITQLCRFFGNPARFLLNKRLGIYLEEDTALLEEVESFELAGLDHFLLGQRLVESRMSGHDLAGLYPSLKAAGMLPHGVPGELAFSSLAREVERFARQVESHIRGEALEPLRVDLPISDFTITGSLPSILAERMVLYRYGSIRAKDRLSLWLQHLILNIAAPPGYPRRSLIMGLRDKKWRALDCASVDNGRQLLEELLQVYWNGLSRPLHFFPETSLLYAEQVLLRGTSPEKALARAKANWTGDDYHRGESRDLSLQLCFTAASPLDTEFQQLSTAVFQPLLANQEELRDHG